VNGRLDQLGSLAGFSRSPVHFAQAIENCATDFPLGIGIQLDIEAGIEIVDRRQQPHHAGRNQVVEADVAGQAVVDPLGDQPDLRQVLKHQGFALLGGLVVDYSRISV